MQLRDYQSRVLDDLWQWFIEHPAGNPIVEAVVGAGKSVLIAALCQRAMSQYAGTRILVVVHQKELLEQNLEKLLSVWPNAPVGIHSAAKGRSDTHHDVIYATIGSIFRKAHLLGRIDLVLADECHLINPKEVGMWRQLISDLKRYNPMCRVIGWTGTPFRGDGVWLTAGESPLFHGIAARVTMAELLALGYLAPLTTSAVRTHIDASGVSISAGDYNIKELAERADRSELVESACDEIVTLAANRKRWLVFCVTVSHAEHVRDALVARGIAAGVVSAETLKAERSALIEDFRSGRLRALCNVAVLTTGFDVPAVDCIALLRNTKSPVLYVQIAGRGMRVLGSNITESIANGKSDCLWLDFTDTTGNLGPVDKIKGRGPKRKKDSAAPVKVCDECGSVVHASAQVCPDCGAEFEINHQDPHGTKASDAQIISSEKKIKRYPVTNVSYQPHQKPGKPQSIQVMYWSALRIVAREWVCPIHGGFAGAKGQRWLEQRGINAEYSVDRGTIDELGIGEWLNLHAHRIAKPPVIVVDESGKYPEIIGYESRPTERTDSSAGERVAQAA